MFKASGVFTFIDTASGVTQDGEKYFAINVMSKGTRKKKLSFITKNEELINRISQNKFIDFQDITIVVVFTREINQNRFSYWNCELIDVGNTRNN